MNNSDKIILDLCGATGGWSRFYKEAGYTVYVITLPEYDLTKTYFSSNRICRSPSIIFQEHCNLNALVLDSHLIYGILVASPCTQFSFARNEKRALVPRNLREGLIVVDKCMEIIRVCQLSGGLKFWALENPKGYLRRFLGKPYLEFNPCDYGDAYTKPTDLWGFFHKPKLNPVYVDRIGDRWSIKSRFTFKDKISPDCTDEYFKKVGGERRIIRRAITPPGLALAFFKENK